MTTEIVQHRVMQVKVSMGDPESAHSMEDQLHKDVLVAIAFKDDLDEATRRALAKEALKTLPLDFPRWCA